MAHIALAGQKPSHQLATPTCHTHLPRPPATPTCHTHLPHPPNKHISHRTKHSGSRVYQVGVTGGLHPLATPICHSNQPHPPATPTYHLATLISPMTNECCLRVWQVEVAGGCGRWAWQVGVVGGRGTHTCHSHQPHLHATPSSHSH